MDTSVRISATPDELASAFARAFREYGTEALARRGMCAVALSGGSTPRTIHRSLAADQELRPLWNGVHLFWGDERCVPPDDVESNYRMARETLIDRTAILPENIHRIRGEDDPEVESVRYEQELRQLVPSDSSPAPRFDVIILGLGIDGHTASLFPGDPDLGSSGRLCRTALHPATGQPRITLTLPVINSAYHVVFVVTGSAKSAVVAEILEHDIRAPREYPAALVRPVSGTLTWFLDEAAAAHIRS